MLKIFSKNRSQKVQVIGIGSVEEGSMNHIIWHNHEVTKAVRAEKKQQNPCLIWFTDLSGSGKSILAGALDI